jgi:6-pyruvoyltetrahydropterin/6-carboxytetrahydropterin synthase
LKLGYIEHIDCAHFLPGHKKCGRPHGHTYKVEVVIEGEKKNGMIMDFGDMKEIIRRVLAEYDHRSLNDFLDYPSVENIAEMLQEKFRSAFSHPFTLRVWEGEGKWCEVADTGPHE